jgi:hypothetical protein
MGWGKILAEENTILLAQIIIIVSPRKPEELQQLFHFLHEIISYHNAFFFSKLIHPGNIVHH